jgi:hypothetical protein
LESPIIKKFLVEKEEFVQALHTYSIPLFLSHSTNSNPYEIPQIISN